MAQPMAKYHAKTTIETEKFEFFWVLENFRYCYGPVGFSIESPVFCMQMNGLEFKWSAKLYPSGIDQSQECVTVVINIKAVPTAQYTPAHFEVNFCSSTSDKRNTKSLSVNLRHPDTYNIKDFGNRKDLDNFLFNGNLTIEFVIYLRKSTINSEPTLEVEQKEKPTLRHRSGFSDFKQLFKSMKLSDVKIIVGDKQIAAHKCVLAARSSVFFAMFDHDTEEKKQNVVRITDIDHKIMIEVLRFMYCEEVRNIEEIAMDLLVAADKYDINDLRVGCEEVLLAELSMENIGDLLVFIDTFPKATKLRTAAFEFIASNLKALKKSKVFQKTMESLSPLLAGLISVIESKM